MSWDNLGSMSIGSAQAVVYSIDGGTNFRWARLDGAMAQVGETNYTDPALAIEAAWLWLNTQGGGELRTRGPGETWVLETTVDSQGNYVTWISDWSLTLQSTTNLNTRAIMITHDYTTLRGLNVDGNRDNQSADGGNPNFISCITLEGAEYCRLEDLYCHHAKWHGINIDNPSKDILVTGCLLSYNDWNGMMDRLECTHTRMLGNWIEHSGDVGIAIYGSYAIVAGNHIHEMDGEYGDVPDPFGQWGIGLEGGTDNKVHGNTITDCRVGIALEGYNWDVTDNNINNMGVHGIHVNEGNGIIGGNDIDEIKDYSADHGWGVGIQFKEIGTINNVHVFDNMLDGESGYVGVKIGTTASDSGDELSFHGNTFDGTPLHAYFIRSANARLCIRDDRMLDGTNGINCHDDGALTDALISNNFIYSMSGIGINIEDCDDILITGNMIRDCATGLDINDANCNGVAVDGNDFLGCTTDVSAAGAGSVVYGGNRDQAGNWDEGVEP